VAKNDAAQVLSRERVQVRSRESRVTLAAWRVELLLPDGARGVVTLAEPFYRGEGALLGASQERLSELWHAALPPDEPGPDLPQLG
jgi:hypothetical protein